MKMYILIKNDVPLGFAAVAAAHASLAAYLRFRDAPETAKWLEGPFLKTVCSVDDEEFARAKSESDHVVITESALGGREVALAFRPRERWPRSFRRFRLFGSPEALAFPATSPPSSGPRVHAN